MGWVFHKENDCIFRPAYVRRDRMRDRKLQERKDKGDIGSKKGFVSGIQPARSPPPEVLRGGVKPEGYFQNKEMF